ncbi:conserved hypothetical protein [Leishmania infantum JPCM5]|uniref:Uncharacterized protein n=3 Tax=Leishmania donovani species complex TaxID=38574 RepID=A4IAH3_LEIIN|nr:conserved hypothetical protein [Leishmania infantum JPCM5]AYU82752.1 hypothetical protein LdCL_340047900 [Leishmania donovani]CAC9541484.1 hypothetical_protein_-_conserved [Leishmania infantum]CAM71830.1 conserved hypothetical protein [Leishmania infantum JPCM5]SUZ45785.1 hypothetical_protein_-_conserved [Leishmania infantum]|eukprot:XP_001468742.1 conserved hypothetical protein [Leishmania infantum JPCM5]
MRGSRRLPSLRLVECTAVQSSSVSRPLAPPPSALITASRRFCIGATRMFYALPHRPHAVSPSSASHPPAKTGDEACSEKGALESPPPSAEARAASATVAAAAPAESMPSNTAGKSTAETTSASAASAAAQPQSLPIQDSLTRRLFASWQQGVVASIGAVMGIGFLLFFLYTPVKEDTVHHTAVVASEALADARLKGQAVQLSKDVVLEVLRNPKSLDATVDVVVELLAREETKIAVSSLLQSLFEDHYTQEVTKKFVLRVVQDPWIQDQLQMITEEQVRKLLNNAAIKTELSKFLLKSAVDSLEKPQLHYEVAKAMRHSVASLVNFWWT